MDAQSDISLVDLEAQQAFLKNDTVHSFSWKELIVTVKDGQTKKMRDLICDINGHVERGELMALMGPSGCGKTTLLNVLARRIPASHARVSGATLVDGMHVDNESFKLITSYVEQEDALIGSLTVQETMRFAAELSLPRSVSSSERAHRVRMLLDAFGIHGQANTLVGTPIRKGISGGQKRRLSVASQLITCPKILFLDEPTSGLDSKASFEVISYVKKLAKRNNLIVIASIHQPSTTTFELFDKVLLLSSGRTCYFGPTTQVSDYFGRIGYPMPQYTNPAEFMLDVVSADFASYKEAAVLWTLGWLVCQKIFQRKLSADVARPDPGRVILSLLHRSLIKSNRDIVAYGIRIVMYLGLAILMGTVWLRLHTSQEYIRPFINAIFFGSAFMSFMAVAYVPAYLEDRATFIKERANGLYGPTPFILSNFLIGLPYLFLISILFSIVAYWLSNFRSSGTAFFSWVMWLFLDLVAAESFVVFVSSVFPISSSPSRSSPLRTGCGCIRLPRHDGQRILPRVFSCGSACHFMYQTDLASQCQIRGTGVLEQYGYAEGRTGKWVGILIAIIAVYRLFGWIALVLRKS
ncbi:hypothetical protein VTN96DRAFT_8977 [Rasamsonia emersonii]